MTVAIDQLTTSNTFSQWLARTNQMANVISTQVLTAGGDPTSGNSVLLGTFTANTVTVPNVLNVSNTMNIADLTKVVAMGANATHFVISANVSTGKLYFSSVGSSADTISGMTDVALSGLSNGHILQYSTGDGKWVNRSLASAGVANTTHVHSASQITSGTFAVARLGSGTANSTTVLHGDGTFKVPSVSGASFNLSTLADVTITSIAAGEILAWDGSTKWINRTLAEAGVAAAAHGHSAADITSGTLGVVRGGTGLSSLTTGYFLYAAGTTSVGQMAPSTVRTTIGAYSTSGGAISGDVSVTGQITATGTIVGYSSDGRLKKNRRPIQSAVAKLQTLTGYSYDWDLDACLIAGFSPNQVHEHGVIAQEVQAVIPDAVHPAPFNKEFLTVDYARLVPLLIEAIKEQQAQIDSLQAQINKEV